MDIKDDSDKGIRILSLDNGGPGTYCQLLIVKECMSRLASDLGVEECDIYAADYFDLMGGVGFGGLAALMLGHLRMNTDHAIDALLSVATAVFPYEAQDISDTEMNTKHIKEAVEGMLLARGIPLDMKMNDTRRPSEKCKVVIYAATSANISHPIPFRTYPARGSSVNLTIVEAICATIATPSFFSPMKIGMRPREQKFIGGPLYANNPTRELLKEANTTFGKDKRVAKILSIGSGRSLVLSTKEPNTTEAASQLIEKLASDCEMVAKELSARLYTVDAYLRLNVDRGVENIRMDEWGELGDIEVHTNAYLEMNSTSEAIEASLRRIKERIGMVTLAQINHSSSIKVRAKTAPSVCPYFVLRRRECDLMVYHLVTAATSGQKIFVLTGMGGCGKTQMVSYFLRENQYLFTHAVFVDASSPASIKADIEAWARSLGDGHEKDSWEDGLRVLADVHHGGWVLVLDNADDPTLKLVAFFPKSYHGTIIVTSRNRDVGNLSTTCHLEVGRMKPEEALSTLLQAAQRQLPLPPQELESAHTLISDLGCLAVALVNAGTYCRQLSSVDQGVLQPYTFTKYLALFYSQRAALMSKAGPSTLDGYERGVYTTLDLSYHAIPETSRDLLHMISHYHHSDIPLAMLAAAAEVNFKDPVTYVERPKAHSTIVSQLYKLLCVGGKWSELQLQDTIQTLRSFSLISTTVIADALFLQIHPLVQAWTRDMVIANAQDYYTMASQIITSCCLKSNIRLYRFLAPHISVLRNQDQNLHVNDKMAVGCTLMEQGLYHDAEIYLNEALDILRDTFEEEAPLTIDAVEKLCALYYYQGRWNEAERVGMEVLEGRRKVLGVDHHDTTNAAVNLSVIYSSQGRWTDSEALDLYVLEQRKKFLGMKHLVTMQANANLASTYRRQKRWDEAERLQVEVLDYLKATLGPEHPETVTATSHLAATYNSQGRLREAETLELEVLELQRNILGEDHPDTIRAAANLAGTYVEQKRWAEGEALFLEVLEQRRRILGIEHPGTIRTLVFLGDTYSLQKRWEDAEVMLSQAFVHSIKVMGQEHPRTQSCIRKLVGIYIKLHKWKQAQETATRLIAHSSSPRKSNS